MKIRYLADSRKCELILEDVEVCLHLTCTDFNMLFIFIRDSGILMILLRLLYNEVKISNYTNNDGLIVTTSLFPAFLWYMFQKPLSPSSA